MSDMQQHLELESLGILRQIKVPAELDWLRDPEKSFLLEMFLAGETGVHRSVVTKREKKTPDMTFNFEVRGLVEWLTDKAGRPVALTLTWKGEDIAKLLHQIAKNESAKQAKVARLAD